MIRRLRTIFLTTALVASGTLSFAHSGPPFPILTNRIVGPYSISIWTDPDTTDDGRAAGQFWVELASTDDKTAIPPGTQATVTVRPLDRDGPSREGRAEPVNGSVSRQFVALLLDHEGPFSVHVSLDGPLGRGAVDSQVNATYDTRPAPWLIVIYLIPFIGVGFLWVKALQRRRAATAGAPRSR
jgi:hypothetical protein